MQMNRTAALSIYSLRLAGLACFALWVAGPALAQSAADCSKSSTINIGDLDARKLGEGEHVIGEAQTPHGKLEVRVSVKRNVISDPVYTIGGKRLKKTALRKVPKDIRSCLRRQKQALAATRLQLAFGDKLQNMSLPKLIDVRFRGRCTVTTSCNQNTCCALAKCGSQSAVDCAGF